VTARPLRVGIIVGEASGDLLGAGLISELQKQFPQLQFEGVLGPKLCALGGRQLFDMQRLAVMGIVDPLKRLPELLSMRRQLIKHFTENPPDVFFGIDAPDFTLGIEKALRKKNIKAVHYVGPSVWAWRQGRIKGIKKSVDLMLTLFPFEKDFYDKHGVPAVTVGHSLADSIPMEVDREAARKQLGLNDAPTLAILPGSRMSEVSHMAALYLQAAQKLKQKLPHLQFVVPLASSKVAEKFHTIKDEVAPELEVTCIDGQAQCAMIASDAVLITSGTATLEAALVKRPMLVAFKAGWLSAAIVRRMYKLPYFSLPNIILGEHFVTELFQEQATVENIVPEVLKLFESKEYQAQVQKKFSTIHKALKKDANKIAADVVVNLILQQ
jgi:lipid-A-disaccharide synthase